MTAQRDLKKIIRQRQTKTGESYTAARAHVIRDRDGAREILMELLCTDLRCLDAHAHLGLLEFDRSPKRAIVHYEIGVRIGELSLPPGFDGVLVWGRIYNRPFLLRCLHGYGVCLWRLGRFEEAKEDFQRILSLNPNDNQGIRFLLPEVRAGMS
jgi:tetratricopeptide (TPR) repeat protein